MALDIYCWLTYRNSYLRKPSRIPWGALAAQFGADYQNRKDFKRYFLAGLRQVLVLYPAPRVEQARAAEVRLPPSTYVRQTALGYRVSGRINAAAVVTLGRIGNNLNQLTRIANTTGSLEDSQHLEAVLKQLLDATRHLA